ncbi:MAG: hypothetical protein KDA47_04775, partial [Planctomycetales bacterium]|nr:hypothetical protein [Planctomycetales bacterium]
MAADVSTVASILEQRIIREEPQAQVEDDAAGASITGGNYPAGASISGVNYSAGASISRASISR